MPNNIVGQKLRFLRARKFNVELAKKMYKLRSQTTKENPTKMILGS